MFAEAKPGYLVAKNVLLRASPVTSLIASHSPNLLLGNLVARNNSRLEMADHLYQRDIAMRSDYV